MPKYLSGRVKRRDQAYLSTDRYQYLGLDQAEPNLGDPANPLFPKVPPGSQFQIVSVRDRPGERFWVPVGGGIIPGSISVFDEGVLVGTEKSITQLNFVGDAVTADAVPLGTAATITVAPPGPNNRILYKDNGEFQSSQFLVFKDNIGIGSVGIGTNDPTENLHIVGNLRLESAIVDENNFIGNTGDLLVKTSTGGLRYTDQRSVEVSAAGSVTQVQFHDSTGLLGGADNFVFDFTNNRIGIGSTQPDRLLDVLGDSRFTGFVNFTDDIFVGVGATVGFGTTAYFRDNAKAVFGDDENLSIYHDGSNSYVEEFGSGQLYIRGSAAIHLENSGGTKKYFRGVNGGSAELFFDGDEKIKTTNEGVLVSGGTTTGDLRVTGFGTFENRVAIGSHLDMPNDARIRLGLNDDLEIYHETSGDTVIHENGSGDLVIRSANLVVKNSDATSTYFTATNEGSVDLFHNNNLRFRTTGFGVTIFETTETQQLKVSGVSTFQDDIFVGTGATVGFGTTSYFRDDASAVFGDDEGFRITRTDTLKSQVDSNGNQITFDQYVSILEDRGDGPLIFKSNGGGGAGAFQFFDTNWRPLLKLRSGNSVEEQATLYYSGEERLSITNEGILVSGGTTTGDFRATGVSTFQDNIFVGVGATVGFGTTAYFRDNAKAVFGDDEDLQIFHSGSNSVIKDGGTGSLIIAGNAVEIKNPIGTKVNAKFLENSSVELYFDDNEKLRTLGAGITVFGNTETQTLNVTGVSTFAGITTVTGETLFTKQLNVSGVSTFQDDIFVGVGATVGFGTTAYFRDDANIILGDDEGFRINRTETLRNQTNSLGGRITFDRYVSIIEDRGDGPLIFKSNGGGGPGAFQFFDTGWRTLLKMKSGSDPSVLLYHLGEERLQTNEQGILVSGGTTTGKLSVTGVSTFVDNAEFRSSVGIGTNNPTGTDALTNNNATLAVGIVTTNSLFSRDLKVSGISTFSNNILPATTNSVDIGESESLRFNRIFAREIFGEINTVQNNQEIGKLQVNGISTFIGLSTFANGIEVVSGTAVFDGNIDANGNLDVDGQTDLDVLNVAELSTFEGNIDANADLDVDGHTELDDLNVSGFSTFVNDAEFKGNVSIAGTLTYEDVTNVDAIGLITARRGIHVTGAGVSVAGISTFIDNVEFQSNVGINTANPQVHNLHVNGNAFVDGELFLRDSSDSKVKLDGQSGSLDIYADGVVRLIESDHDKEMITFDINTTHNDGRIYFEGDKDTFLNHPGDNQLGLAAGGFEIIRITSDTMSIGNTVPNMKVGIGTDNPTGENALTDNNSTLAVGIITTNSSFTHDLKVSGVSTFAGITTVTGETLFTKQLNVSGVSTFVGVVTTGNDLFVGGDIHIKNANPTLTFTDNSGTPNNPDFRIIGNAGKLAIQDIQDSHAERFVISSGGLIEIQRDLEIGRHLKVTGVSTFKDDVEFHGASGIASITFDKSANELNFKNNAKAVFGDDEDLKIYHTGNHSIIKNDTGNLILQDDNNIVLEKLDGTNLLVAAGDGVKLYFDGNEKIKTTNEGVLVSGGTTTGTLSVTGVSTFADDIFVGTGATVGFGSTVYFRDNVKAVFGDNDNLLIEHLVNGDSRIIEAGSGNLYIGVGGEISNSTFNINVSNDGASGYILSGSDRNGSVSGTSSSGSEINVTLNVGDTVNFVVNASGHPFFIKTAATTGTGDQASGVTNNGAESGTVSWTPSAAGTYYYICQYHGVMVGTITVQSNSASGGRNLNITEGFSANYLAQFRTNNSVDLYFNRNLKFKTTNEGILVSGGTTTGDFRATGVSTFVGISTFNDQIFTNKISNSGIITSNMIHLTGGSFTAPHPSGDTKNDTAIVVNENFGIYALELQGDDGSNDNRYLRRIIEKENNILTIGQDDTSLFSAINIRPGVNGTVSIGHSGAVSLVGVSEDGYTPNIEKLRTVGTGITVFGNTETQTLNVTGVSTFAGIATVTGHTLFTKQLNVAGISTFNDNTIIDGSLTVGSNHSFITGGAPTDQGNLAVYGTGKNSLIIQTTSNSDDRGIAWRNSGDAYVAYIAAVNRGNSSADLRFGVDNSNNSNVNSVEERMRITREGNVGINSTAPIAKLDVDGSFHVSGNIGIGSTIPISRLDVNGQTDLDVLNVSDTATFDANINANGNIVGDNATAITGISRISGSGAATMAVQNVQYVSRSSDQYGFSFLNFDDQNVPPFGSGGNFTTLASISGLNLIYDTNDNDNNGFVVGVGSTNVSDANAFTAHMVIDHTGKVGFGTNDPDQTLHVYKGSAGTVASDGNAVLTIENDHHSILQILSPSNRSGRIMFGDPDDVNVGQISYDHNASPEKLIFDVGGSTRVAINSEGSLLPGGSSQDIGADENRWNTLFVNEVNASGGSIVVDNYETNILKVNGISTFIGLSTFADGIQVVSGIATFDGAIDANGGANIDGGLVVNSAKISDLTENRVVIVGSDGELEDSANLTFNGSLLNVTGGVAFSGDIDANANLDVDGHTELDNLNVSGISTFVNNAEFKANVSIAGTLTYEDVTNVDAIGLITARNGIHVTGAGVSVAGISTFINDVEFRSKIGIGTTNPQQDLHIQDNVPVIRLTKQNGTTDNKHWNIGAGTAQILRIQASRDTGGGGGNFFDFYRDGNQITEFRGSKGGNAWFVVDNHNRRVGIGSTTPTEQLDVAGNINVGGGTTLQSSTTTGTGKALRIISPSGYIEVGSQNNNNAHFYTDRPRFYFNKRLIVDEGIIGSFNEDLVLATDETENRIRIKNGTGDVGIGQDDPTSRLHVTDSVDNIGIATLLTLHSIRTDMPTAQAAGGSIRFLNEDGNNKGQAFIQANCPSIYDNDLGNEGERERTVDFNFVQSNASLNNLNTRLTIKGETGNVGIGTTRPDGRLHVSDGNAIVTGGSFGIGTTNPLLQLDVRGSLGISAVTDTSLRTTISSSSGGLIINHGDNSPTIFQNAGIERVRFEDTGEVGINSTTPAARLDVFKSYSGLGVGNAAARIYGTDSGVEETGVRFVEKGTNLHTSSTAYLMRGISNGTTKFVFGANGNVGIGTTIPNYNLHIIGTAAATNFDSLSDRKVKTNIQVIQNPIDKIKKIDGVSFNWKSDNKPSLGVIADNVEEVLPEIVSGNDPKSVNYNGLIGLLIEVVKDQQKQIDELRGLLDK